MESIGSLYIDINPKYKVGWRLMRTFYIENKRKQKTVPRTAWSALGFSDSMTVEQAKGRVAQLNAENSIRRQEQQRIAGIATRVERDRLHHSAFIPEDLNTQFIKWLETNTSGSPGYIEKLKIIWGTAKRAVISLQLLPEHFEGNKKQIYRYFATQEYSADYVRKLLMMLNQYGRFTARLTAKYYEPIPSPRGADREMINDAYLDSPEFRGASEPLSPDLLEDLKRDLKPAQYRWLFLSVWLGLRPSECDMILQDRAKKLWRVESGKVDILWVYQPKLTSKPRNLRWKPIPLLYPEQQEALSILMEGDASAPLTKTLKRLSSLNITKYGGRKGFTDLMLDKGQALEHIAQWLGHSSIEMTWQRYKDRGAVHYTLPVSK
jgi:hypothetical protein